MKKATQRIVKQFPFFEQKLQDCHNVLLFEQALQSLGSDVEKTFLKLVWFFEIRRKKTLIWDVCTNIYKTIGLNLR